VTPDQCRIARAALKWSLTDLASESGIGRATVARFELGQTVQPETITKLRAVFENHRIRFIEEGTMAGGVYRIRGN
jgi:transcriptional regulator with XRE-family HTH domain